ncbi:MAG: hypothetical protein P9M03_00265 [Candidatus Theseobacter exili]|nr:hypothetical protein [Candidatus Theseobacter exili]
MKIRKCLFLAGLGIGAFTIIWASPILADETLQNPGFEDGENSWYNWNVGENSGEISGTHKRGGTWAAQRDIFGKGMGCFGQELPVRPGQTVSCKAWVFNPKEAKLTAGAEIYLRIEFWNDEEPLKAGHIDSRHLANSTTDWTLLKAKTMAPAGATQTRILAYTLGRSETSKGTAYFDDFEVTIE